MKSEPSLTCVSRPIFDLRVIDELDWWFLTESYVAAALMILAAFVAVVLFVLYCVEAAEDAMGIRHHFGVRVGQGGRQYQVFR